MRQNTAALRVQLAEAQRVLELRKGYDELAARLIDPKKLKPRVETREDIEILGKEIEELEQESGEVEGMWWGRREAFERVVEEGRGMMRVVKGIKDEPEHEADKDEGMEVEVEVEDGEGKEGGERSRIGTPGAGRTPVPRDMTPLVEEAEADAGEDSGDGRALTNTFLEVEDEVTRASSQAGTPMMDAQVGEDVEMAEEEDQATLEPQPKTTAGMEVAGEQVATPAEGMEGTEDQAEGDMEAPIELVTDSQGETPAAPVLMEEAEEEQEVATPAEAVEEMDES